MKPSIKYVVVVLTFLVIDLYAGIRLFHYIKELNLRHRPVSVDIVEGVLPKLAAPVDIDRDGEDEVAFSQVSGFPNMQLISVFIPLNRDFCREYYGDTRAPRDAVFFDYRYDPRLETYVFRFLETRERDLVVIEIDNRETTLPYRLEFERLERPFEKDENWSPRPQLVDLDADDKNELVVILNSDDPGNPRGAACFDPVSGKKHWEYYSGTRIENAFFHDLDHDGKKEIVLTSRAANNEIELNGTSDRYSYVIVLDCKGKERWKQDTGDWYTNSRVTVSDLEGDGRYEIVASAESAPGRRNVQGKVFIFDARTGTRKNSFPPLVEESISFSRPYVLKLTGAGPRIYVGDSGGRLWILDKNLVPLKKVETGGPVHVLNTSPPGERRYYLYTRCRNRLMVFDWDLETEVFSMDFDFEGPFEYLPLRPADGHHALVKADKLYLLTESKASFQETSRYWVRSGLLFTVVVLFLFNGFFIYFLYRWDIPLSRYFRGTRTPLIEISELYDIVRVIVHQVKNPISTVLWTAEKIKRDSSGIKNADAAETFIQLADVLLENVHVLKRHTREISKLVEENAPSSPPGKETTVK